MDLKVRDGQEKWILREAFADLLPDYIRRRPKNPMSHSSGLHERARLYKPLFARIHRSFGYDRARRSAGTSRPCWRRAATTWTRPSPRADAAGLHGAGAGPGPGRGAAVERGAALAGGGRSRGSRRSGRPPALGKTV